MGILPVGSYCAIYLFFFLKKQFIIFGCVGSSLLCVRAVSSCGVWASHCGGFSCGVQARVCRLQ